MEKSGQGISAALRALATGDLGVLAQAFAVSGWRAWIPVAGILHVESEEKSGRPRVLLSVGVHGDETAPIELVERLLTGLAATPTELAVDLMVVVGNPVAIAQGRRYLDADLNRLFKSDRPAASAASQEAARADQIMATVQAFMAVAHVDKWHLDLHTTIRASHFPAFAIVPDVLPAARLQALLAFLGRTEVAAAILNRTAAGTFSAYTATRFGAASATLELGQVSALGTNTGSGFAATQAALDFLLRTGQVSENGNLPAIFRVAQELIKTTDDFRLACKREVQNFAAFAPGTLIAHDGATVYRCGSTTEYVVFPNPDVALGMRAGLMVVAAS